jgi:hypothetical protein
MWAWAQIHPFLFFWMVIILAFFFCTAADNIVHNLAIFTVRRLNILDRGWPPPHLGADGNSVLGDTDDE